MVHDRERARVPSISSGWPLKAINTKDESEQKERKKERERERETSVRRKRKGDNSDESRMESS